VYFNQEKVLYHHYSFNFYQFSAVFMENLFFKLQTPFYRWPGRTGPGPLQLWNNRRKEEGEVSSSEK
jgi:hypothetical protein